MELQDDLARRGYTLLRRLNRKPDAQILLLRRRDGTKFVCRVYDHEVPPYEAVLDIHIPQLPAVYAYTRADGRVIVEEEFVDGILLSEVLECSLADTGQTAAIAAQVCAALTALHERGIIHRDVKPEHVILTAEGRVVLVDLDAASDYDPDKARDTRLLGTVGYAAPEQFGFARSDERTDIFGLGVLMNVMRTGRHPSGGLAEGELQSIIETCVAMDAARRYRTADELAARLRPIAGEDGRCPKCGFVTPGGGCLYCGDPSPAPARRRRERRSLAALAAVFLALGLLFVGNALLTFAPEPSGREPQPPVEMPSGDDDLTQTSFAYYPLDWDDWNSHGAPTPFSYDLDGDGAEEDYYFGVLLDVGLPLHYLRTDVTNFDSPDDEHLVHRICAPAVFRLTEEGEYLPVKDFAPLLQDASVTLYYSERRADADTLPLVYGFGTLDGWSGAVEIQYRIPGGVGRWVMEARATLDGTTYTGICTTTIFAAF